MRSRRVTHGVPFPNLAPMVDVVMVILVFFMLGAGFAAEETALLTRMPTDVGPGGDAAVRIIPAVELALFSDGERCRITLVGREVNVPSFDELEVLLRTKIRDGVNPRGEVVVSADGDVRYEHVIAALDAALRAGFSDVRFAVESGSLLSDPGPDGLTP